MPKSKRTTSVSKAGARKTKGPATKRKPPKKPKRGRPVVSDNELYICNLTVPVEAPEQTDLVATCEASPADATVTFFLFHMPGDAFELLAEAAGETDGSGGFKAVFSGDDIGEDVGGTQGKVRAEATHPQKFPGEKAAAARTFAFIEGP